MRPLKKCSNGCDAPPHPPSAVLCRVCFDALDAKMNSLGEPTAASTTRSLGDTAEGPHAERARRFLGRNVYSFGPSMKSLHALQVEALAAEFDAVEREAQRELLAACEAALLTLSDMTTEDFRIGADRPIRDRLAAAIKLAHEGHP